MFGMQQCCIKFKFTPLALELPLPFLIINKLIRITSWRNPNCTKKIESDLKR